MFFCTGVKLRFILITLSLQTGTCARPYGCGASLHFSNKRSELAVVMLGAGVRAFTGDFGTRLGCGVVPFLGPRYCGVYLGSGRGYWDVLRVTVRTSTVQYL